MKTEKHENHPEFVDVLIIKKVDGNDKDKKAW
jgi:hypothetical protein